MDKILFLDDFILQKLRDNTSIPWVWSLAGPAFPDKLTGYLCSSHIEYSDFTKDGPMGTAVFDLWIISPDLSGGKDTEKQVESVTLKVKDLLMDDYTLGGHAVRARVESIQFAPPAGKAVAGASHITYRVEFEDYEED